MDIILICEKYIRYSISLPEKIISDLYRQISESGRDWLNSEDSVLFTNLLSSFVKYNNKNFVEIVNINYSNYLFESSNFLEFEKNNITAESIWASNWDSVLFYSDVGFRDMLYNYNIIKEPNIYLGYQDSYQLLEDDLPNQDISDDGFYDLDDLSHQSDREKMLSILNAFAKAMRNCYSISKEESIYFSPSSLLQILDRSDYYLSGSADIRNVLMSDSTVTPLFAQATSSFLYAVRYICYSIFQASPEGQEFLYQFYKVSNRYEYIKYIRESSDTKPLSPPPESKISAQIAAVWVKFWQGSTGSGAQSSGYS